VWNLFRTHLAGKKEQWMLVKSHDAQARSEAEYSIVEAQPDSVISDRTLLPRGAVKAAKATGKPRRKRGKNIPLPEQLHPQLATLVDSPPSGDWRYEVKYK